MLGKAAMIVVTGAAGQLGPAPFAKAGMNIADAEESPLGLRSKPIGRGAVERETFLRPPFSSSRSAT